MKSVFVVTFVALLAFATAATRFSNPDCYEEAKACASAALRKECPYTRWQCRELGHGSKVVGDTQYTHITGDCDEMGPRVFCKTAEEAGKCGADKKFCNSVGYWHF